jgi:hypothetical protein
MKTSDSFQNNVGCAFMHPTFYLKEKSTSYIIKVSNFKKIGGVDK